MLHYYIDLFLGAQYYLKGRNVLYLISSYPPKMINEYERQQKRSLDAKTAGCL